MAVTGYDDRAVVFGAGWVLRHLTMARQRLELDAGLSVTSAPAVAVRGHQLGYRPKTNSYDAWTVPMWEQYIRDLAVFGTNAIELIPPRSDDDADSPHFPLPPMRDDGRRCRASPTSTAWTSGSGIRRWTRTTPTRRRSSSRCKEWGEVFQQLPRIDAVFVPGGDPGHTAAEVPDGAARKADANCCTRTTPRRRCGSRRRASTRRGWTSSSAS